MRHLSFALILISVAVATASEPSNLGSSSLLMEAGPVIQWSQSINSGLALERARPAERLILYGLAQTQVAEINLTTGVITLAPGAPEPERAKEAWAIMLRAFNAANVEYCSRVLLGD